MGKMGDLENSELHSKSKGFKSLSAVPSKRYVWYSFCSAHREIDDQCTACHSGTWVDELDPGWIADQQLFNDHPERWIKRHNPGMSMAEAAQLYELTSVNDLANLSLDAKRMSLKSAQLHPSKTNDGGRDGG